MTETSKVCSSQAGVPSDCLAVVLKLLAQGRLQDIDTMDDLLASNKSFLAIKEECKDDPVLPNRGPRPPLTSTDLHKIRRNGYKEFTLKVERLRKESLDYQERLRKSEERNEILVKEKAQAEKSHRMSALKNNLNPHGM